MQIKQNIQGSFGIKDRLCKGFTPCRKAVRLKTDRSFLPAGASVLLHICMYICCAQCSVSGKFRGAVCLSQTVEALG